MQYKFKYLILLFNVGLLASCNQEAKIEVSFKMVELLKMGKQRAVRIEIRNHSDQNLFVLSPITLEKVGIKHPCKGERMLATYSKISSYPDGDCGVYRGENLFHYLKTVPFVKNDHMKLKDSVMRRGGDVFDSFFDYLVPVYDEQRRYPSDIFIRAKSSSFIYFTVIEPLEAVDKGTYKVNWIPKREFDELTSIKRARASIKDAFSVTVNGYQFYDGNITVHPLMIKL